MIFNSKKFTKEINELKNSQFLGMELGKERKAEIKSKLLQSVATENIKVDETSSPDERYTVYARINQWKQKYMLIKYAKYVLPTLVVFLFSGTVYASNSSLPGDTLFPVKKLKENIQLGLTLNNDSKAELKTEFAEKRLTELDDVEDDHRPNAQNEVSNALDSLRKVQEELILKGNINAANAVGEVIIKLESRLTRSSGDDENEDSSDDNNSSSGSSSDQDGDDDSNERRGSSENRGSGNSNSGSNDTRRDSNSPSKSDDSRSSNSKEIELRGIVFLQAGQFYITSNGQIYQLVGVGLNAFASGYVEIHGILGDNNQIQVREIKLEDSSSDSNEDSHKNEDSEDQDDDEDSNSGRGSSR